MERREEGRGGREGESWEGKKMKMMRKEEGKSE